MRNVALMTLLALGLAFSPAAAEAKTKPFKTAKAAKTKAPKNKQWKAAAKKRKAPKRKAPKSGKGAN
jgi:hypothetical protein